MSEECEIEGPLFDDAIMLVMTETNHHHTLGYCIAAAIVLEKKIAKLYSELADLRASA